MKKTKPWPRALLLEAIHDIYQSVRVAKEDWDDGNRDTARWHIGSAWEKASAVLAANPPSKREGKS